MKEREREREREKAKTVPDVLDVSVSGVFEEEPRVPHLDALEHHRVNACHDRETSLHESRETRSFDKSVHCTPIHSMARSIIVRE